MEKAKEDSETEIKHERMDGNLLDGRSSGVVLKSVTPSILGLIS